jgi:hypothetical protein
MAYTDQQINDFLELAQEVGITRAKRELGFPKSWATAQMWAKNRNVTVAVDEIMAKTREAGIRYEAEDVVTVAQEGMQRVYQELMNNPDLAADDQKKLAEALQKHYNVWAAAQGKATNITESRQTDTMDEHILELLNVEKAKNALGKENVTSNI